MSSDPEPPDTDEATAVVNVDDLLGGEEEDSSPTACVTVMSGPHVGRLVTLEEGDVTVGRDRGCDLHIPDEKVSRKHARIFWSDDEVMIRDLESSNGTLVGSTRVYDAHPLRDGDKITVGGSVTLKFAFQDRVEQSFQEQMYEASLRDGLTKAYNKEFLTEHLRSEMSFANRHDTDLSLILFDLDHFKEVNDTYGHLAGDAVLKELADMTRASIRTEDLFARYGGEEFAIVLREIALPGARVLAERLRKLVAEENFAFKGDTIPVTISIGIASMQSARPRTPKDLIAAADEALYQAKDRGRNRTCLHGSS